MKKPANKHENTTTMNWTRASQTISKHSKHYTKECPLIVQETGAQFLV